MVLDVDAPYQLLIDALVEKFNVDMYAFGVVVSSPSPSRDTGASDQ